MMYWWHAGWDWWDWFGMMLIMLVFWSLVLAGIVALLRYFESSERSRAEPHDLGGDILARRFAMGEIDSDEYLRRLEVLGLRRPVERASQVKTDPNREAEPTARC
jgi:putative membrane protein